MFDGLSENFQPRDSKPLIRFPLHCRKKDMIKKFADQKDLLCEKMKQENTARWLAYGPGAPGMQGEDGVANYRLMRVQGYHGLSQVDAQEYEDHQKAKKRERARAKRQRNNASRWCD